MTPANRAMATPIERDTARLDEQAERDLRQVEKLARERKSINSETGEVLDGRITPNVDGAEILSEVETYLKRFVSYPSEAALVAHVLWVAHTHWMEVWDSTPRIAFLSPEPASGKSRALEVTEPLVPRPVEAINVTPAYLFRKVADEKGRPTILYDEIDTVFGPRAKENEELRGLLNAGHRRHAMAGRCVVRGKQVFTEELPAYCAVALAGLGALPETILSRSVVIKMRRRGPGEIVEPYRRRINGPQGEAIRSKLASWVASFEPVIWALPPDITDRDADAWEGLISVANAAGGKWLERALKASRYLIAESRQSTPSLGVQLLVDTRAVFLEAGDPEVITTESLLEKLHALPDSPWCDLRGKPLDARGLSYRLRQYGIAPKTNRQGDRTPRGYERAAFLDAWARYLPPVSPGSKTSKTSETEPPESPLNGADVSDVSDVLDVLDFRDTEGVTF